MIECVLSQTFSDFEFIIVDNGSSDDSGKIADRYALMDNRISVIHRQRGNIGSGRNAGLDVSTGEYVAFIDDDDELEADYFQYLYDLLMTYKADISICSERGNRVDTLLVMNNEEAIEQLLWRKNYNNQFILKLIRRSLFDHCRFSSEAKYDDIELMTPILAKAKKVVFGGEPKYIIHRHANNHSRWTQNHQWLDLQTLDEYLHVYRVRTVFLTKIFPKKSDLWQYFEWSFWLSMVDKIIRFNLEDCFIRKDELQEKLMQSKKQLLACTYLFDFEKEWAVMFTKER
jgi:glycosyltransferase involved in cell wall biosynthesis